MKDSPLLTKSQLAALEALFVQELPNAGRARIHPATGAALVKKGLAEDIVFTIPSRLGQVKVKAWKLTIAGHYLYCSSCREQNSPGDGELTRGDAT